MGMIMNNNTLAIREMSMEEIDNVSGGVIPLVVAVFYMTGFTAGVGAGYVFGKDLWG